MLGLYHGDVALLIAGFAIKWRQGHVTGQLRSHDSAHVHALLSTQNLISDQYIWSVVNCSETGLGGEYS